MAKHDALTGLPNRRLLSSRLRAVIAGAQHKGETAAVVARREATECDLVQGCPIAKSMSCKALLPWLANWSGRSADPQDPDLQSITAGGWTGRSPRLTFLQEVELLTLAFAGLALSGPATAISGLHSDAGLLQIGT